VSTAILQTLGHSGQDSSTRSKQSEIERAVMSTALFFARLLESKQQLDLFFLTSPSESVI
jgi:hypothetical protein